MEQLNFEILKKNIPKVKIPSLTGMTWFDSNDVEVPWTIYDTPTTGDSVYNTYTGLTDIDNIESIGYYTWSGSTWKYITTTGTTEEIERYILNEVYGINVLPIFLETTSDEMGVMVGFDGEIEQIEQFCNFTYTYVGNTLTIYNSLNTNRLKTIIDSEFNISWGDGATDTLVMSTVYDVNLPSLSHTYGFTTGVTVTITVDSPWKVQSVSRTFILPFSGYTFPTEFGTLTFEIPFSNPVTGTTQDYLVDYRTTTGTTSGATISFLAIGKSRMDELKGYGKNSPYTGLTYGDNYTGYTIDGLFYMDYTDGYTHITGLTSSYDIQELYDGKLTRNEHLIGFVDEPQIYSDIFVERGKLGIMERNLRLGEIENMGELVKYGSGYFNVKKQ